MIFVSLLIKFPLYVIFNLSSLQDNSSKQDKTPKIIDTGLYRKMSDKPKALIP